MASKTGEIVQKIALFGVGGWFAENALCQQDRYSSLFRGTRIPFMPIYAANGLILTAVSDYLSKWPTLARGLVYAVLGTGVEWAGCRLDRWLLDGRSMVLGNDALTQLSSGCVNFQRAVLWGGLGLVAEKM